MQIPRSKQYIRESFKLDAVLLLFPAETGNHGVEVHRLPFWESLDSVVAQLRLQHCGCTIAGEPTETGVSEPCSQLDTRSFVRGIDVE